MSKALARLEFREIFGRDLAALNWRQTCASCIESGDYCPVFVSVSFVVSMESFY